MKKLLVILIAILLLGSTAMADFTNLHDLQNYVYNTPASHADPYGPKIHIKGVITDIHFLNGNHYELVLEVDEEKAATALGHELPCLVATFRLHVDEPPFEVGQEAYIIGKVNLMYSCPMIPNVILEEINGYSDDDF